MANVIEAVELIFAAPWVFIIAVASVDVLRDFWIDLRRYLVRGDGEIKPCFVFTTKQVSDECKQTS